jgi:hypothetical protein
MGKSRFAAIVDRTKRRVSDPIPLPGDLGTVGGGMVSFRKLRDQELTEARAEAVSFLEQLVRTLEKRKLEEDRVPPELYFALDENFLIEEGERQILLRAMRDPENPEQPLAGSVGELRAGLDADARKALMTAYNTWKDDEGPVTRVKTLEEARGLVAAVGKEQRPSLLWTYYDRFSLANIVIELDDRLTTLLKTPSSSSGPSPSPEP